MKNNQTSDNEFRTHQTVSPEQIIAAGGTTAFGLKSGKNNESIIKALENSPMPEPFSKDEWENLLDQLAKDK